MDLGDIQNLPSVHKASCIIYILYTIYTIYIHIYGGPGFLSVLKVRGLLTSSSIIFSQLWVCQSVTCSNISPWNTVWLGGVFFSGPDIERQIKVNSRFLLSTPWDSEKLGIACHYRVCSEYWDLHNTNKNSRASCYALTFHQKKTHISGTKLQKRKLQKKCNPLHIQACILWHNIFHPTTLHTSWLEYWIEIALQGLVIAWYFSTKSPAANALRHSISGSSLTGNKPSKSLDWETALSWKNRWNFTWKLKIQEETYNPSILHGN